MVTWQGLLLPPDEASASASASFQVDYVDDGALIRFCGLVTTGWVNLLLLYSIAQDWDFTLGISILGLQSSAANAYLIHGPALDEIIHKVMCTL